jgi:hypothetical protein
LFVAFDFMGEGHGVFAFSTRGDQARSADAHVRSAIGRSYPPGGREAGKIPLPPKAKLQWRYRIIWPPNAAAPFTAWDIG